MKKSTLIIVLALVLIAIGFAVLVRNTERHTEEVRYNDGICTECHKGHLEQKGTWTDRADGTEFNRFVCDNCHEVYLFRFIGEKK